MHLNKIHVIGFRSLKDVEIDFSNLTVLIGENDAGKSSILDLLEIFLGSKSIEKDDFYFPLDGSQETKIEITCEFDPEERDELAQEFANANKITVKKTCYANGVLETEYLGQKLTDETLNIDFTSLAAPAQKVLIQSLQTDVLEQDISNTPKRIEWFANFSKHAPKIDAWLQLPVRLEKLLPRLERYSAMDYKSPSTLVAKTLKQVYEQTIHEPAQENAAEPPRLIKELRDVEEKATKQLSIKIKELEGYITRYNKRVKGFDYHPKFDFLDSLKPGEFLVNSGRGLHPLSKVGDGSKRRLYMAVMDWDKDVTLAQSKSEVNLQLIIRGYDEPDTNLHYGAQRLMYQSIEEIVNAENSRIQAILCTHSLAMIDRAPTQNIRMLSMNDQGCTEVQKLDTQDDPDVENFLLGLARELGITNSMIFYERCFVLIEGETEENALPILYKKIYKRSMVEDGIRVINVRGNGAVKEFLKILSNNRHKYTLVFIDRDTMSIPSAKLRLDILQNAHFAEEFLHDHVFYIGTQEFEDSFANIAITDCLNQNWPKKDVVWQEGDIQAIRDEKKFSESLRKLIFEKCAPDIGTQWSKPVFGKVLAETCSTEQIPVEIKTFFEKARAIADGT